MICKSATSTVFARCSSTRWLEINVLRGNHHLDQKLYELHTIMKNKKFIVIEVTTCEATFNLLPLISGPIFFCFPWNLWMSILSWPYIHIDIVMLLNLLIKLIIFWSIFSVQIILQSLNSNRVMQEHEEKASVSKMVSF